MHALLRAVLLAISALLVVDAALITASLFITDRAPVSRQAFLVSLMVSVLFLALAWLSAGIRRQMTRLGYIGEVVADTAFRAPFGSLVGHLLVAATLFALFMALLTYAILARIDQNFAVFG
jgi:hypothetical protein